ncbi:hypothetical protein OQJ19_01070 [Fluoribacter gormanii]|uniref:hypothetical protein n=1 Tax=Fluoribacter gormanii TaxID=464 RepID=UPI001041848D|nr:hypothetical protein [Fluoribacter gormanii]MCW8444069.1 hypothetical protein [Fluoribacter gormanii]MCW8469251.1 hypothetical protein [Fluoribacter gormanii]
MGFQYVEYDKLAKYIRESIATELKSHNLDEKDIPKSLRLLSISHPERAIQCKYLRAILICLEQPDIKDDKTRVLNAAAFYIRAQIHKSYQGTVTPYFLSPENSTLYNALTTSLNLTLDNFPDSKDLIDMYDALSHFMHAQVYVDSDPRKGYLPPSKQPFSSKKIKDYKVEKVLQDLVKKVADFRAKEIDQTKEQQFVKDSDIKNRARMFSDKVIPPASDSPTSKDSLEPISNTLFANGSL